MKGISAIIATIMLLMITVALIGVFYAFSSTMATQTTSSGSEQVSQLTKQLSSCMHIRNIYGNQVTLENCGKGVIENKSLIVMMDDTKLGASTQTIQEGNSSIVNISGLWQIAPGKHNLKISNGAAFALMLVEVEPRKDGLVGSWSFNEGSGTFAGDGSGNGNTGTLLPTGSEPQWVNGKFNKGLQFDGANDYVKNITDASSLDITDSITIALWFNNFTNKNGVILSKGYDLPQTSFWIGYILRIDDKSGTFKSRFNTINGNNKYYYELSLPVFGGWNFVATNYDKSNKKMQLFLNGVINETNTAGDSINQVGTPNLLIGKATSSPRYFNGIIDEVRIWNIALTPDETTVMKQLI